MQCKLPEVCNLFCSLGLSNIEYNIQHLEIKTGLFGLGAFATQKIPKGAFIGGKQS